ncbi:hypothetical protein BD408DRAFT_58765 [Parasitella parasitica]|nr:hypothetical protein BD408DRAFT_58765 [Parasitella parasitica]
MKRIISPLLQLLLQVNKIDSINKSTVAFNNKSSSRKRKAIEKRRYAIYTLLNALSPSILSVAYSVYFKIILNNSGKREVDEIADGREEEEREKPSEDVWE